ncbi:M20 aminoacylase family protein [Orbus sturtevantii]|uniref:M20 aminoacylase family protein n=1 Tax=Orbus sturtevantii TaxID=3074109 RepID=UPI00370D6B75
MTTKIIPEISDIQHEMIAIRHQLHQHPEIGFEEFKTSELVANLLTQWGYQVTRGLGGTGVVAQLKNGNGPAIGIRADMDALPIDEATKLSHASQIKGKMHACGHDGHTATLLTTARYFAQHRHFNGTINLIFQPAEEGLSGGLAMVEDGLFKKFPCDYIFAFHNMPKVEAGKMAFIDGPAMASSDSVTIKVKGRGGHGAMPHLSIDPVVVASSIVMALQTIVSRNANPLETAIITVGSFQAGDANNVIPDEAILKLTIRALDPSMQDLIEKRVKELVTAQAASYGAEVEIDYKRLYPMVINDLQATELARNVALSFFGEAQIIPDFPKMTGSEDFSFMLQQCKGAYIFVGNGTEGHNGCSLHNPKYDFNDAILPVVASYWVKLIESYLK